MGESSLIGGASGAGTVEVAREPMSLGQSDGQAAEAWVIGIDCAAQDRNMGLVLGRVRGPKVEVEAVAFNKNDVRPILSEWIRYRNPLILSLD
ncbi:MAG: hypothetical protein R6T96_13685, partial [Longimicrobiales bacterium]